VTEQRVSQSGAEALIRVSPDADVSQSGAEFLHRVQPGFEISQAGAEYLHRVQPSFAISQIGAEVLYKSVPCTTQWCQIWTIERTDGQTYRFTSLDQDFPYRGEVYQACDSLVPSASEAVSEVDAAGNMDLSGALGTITEHDLYAGLFDGAQVEAWLVPWEGVGPRKRLLKGNFGPLELGPNGFKVELVGDGAKLQQTPLVRTLQPGCRWLFGDIGCGKDLGPLTVTGTIDSAAGEREFTDAARSEPAGYFSRGRVTFTSGDNAGVSAEIKEHAAGGVFTLWPRLAFAIAAGDEYSMTPGCTNLHDSSGGTNGCTAWANKPRYGGFRKVPGGDKRSSSADVR
jgi:uncharacterized phage protein (TIGR02218 family)